MLGKFPLGVTGCLVRRAREKNGGVVLRCIGFALSGFPSKHACQLAFACQHAFAFKRILALKRILTTKHALTLQHAFARIARPSRPAIQAADDVSI